MSENLEKGSKYTYRICTLPNYKYKMYILVISFPVAFSYNIIPFTVFTMKKMFNFKGCYDNKYKMYLQYLK